MKKSPDKTLQDRWWLMALSVSVFGTGFLVLLWNFPGSKWVWAIASCLVLFAAATYFNPRYRIWRRANVCFATAGLLAVVPSFAARVNVDGFGGAEFVADSSPLLALGFLVSGLFLVWFDSRSLGRAGGTTSSADPSVVNSPHSITDVSAGGNITINQGVSENTVLAVLELQRLSSSQADRATADRAKEIDEDLIWRLLDDIKVARRSFEREEIAELLGDLRRSFAQSGACWPKVLRTEAILLLAEEERARILEARAEGRQIGDSVFQALLKELPDAGK